MRQKKERTKAQESNTTQKRLSILGEDEIETLFGRPRFTHEERIQYFSLSQLEKDLLQGLRSVKSQAYFVLQLGYFKAKHLFFILASSRDPIPLAKYLLTKEPAPRGIGLVIN